MKQTAVEYLLKEIQDLTGLKIAEDESIVEVAKEMEKQQIIKAWYDCKMSVIEKNPTTADEYYNETFNK